MSGQFAGKEMSRSGVDGEASTTRVADYKWVGEDLTYIPSRIVVMIPCHNEAKTVASVIERVPRVMPEASQVLVVVIDDGSTDGTAQAASQAGADEVFRHKRRLGLGTTYRDGLRVSLDMGGEVIVSLDGDGQYDPTEIPLLLAPIMSGDADIVLGDRRIKHLDHMSRGRRLGNRLASWVIRRVSGLPVRDAQTGFRAMAREAAERLTLRGAYTYTQEMIVEASHRGLAVRDVPITFRRREDGDSRLITSLWRYAALSGSVVLRAYRDHNPITVFSILGAVFLVVGGIFGLRVLIHFWSSGTISPFLPSAILAAMLGVVGFQVIIFGLLADMLKSQRELNEEVLLQLRKRR